MAELQLLQLPEECLIMIFRCLDMRSQCNFAFTCRRFQRIYHVEHHKHFRHFVWYERTHMWKRLEIEAFFKLNGHKMEMVSISDVRDYNFDIVIPAGLAMPPVEPLHSKSIYVANVCVYLKNLRSLILCIDHHLAEIVIEICRHMRQLEDLTIDSSSHPNYEFLPLLPRLKSLDIQYFAKDAGDKMLQMFAEVRPDVLEHLRIGSELNADHAIHIAKLRSLRMLNVYNPCPQFVEHLHRMSLLRVVCLTNADQLDDFDCTRLVCELNYLSSLYVSHCSNLTNEFVFIIMEHLQHEQRRLETVRSLPFYFEGYRVGITKAINKDEIVMAALANGLIELNLKKIKNIDDVAAL